MSVKTKLFYDWPANTNLIRFGAKLPILLNCHRGKPGPIAKFQSSKHTSWEVFRSWFRSLWKRESQMWVLSSTILDVRCDVFSPQSERRRQICFKSLRCRCEVGHSGSRRHGCQRSGSAPKSDDTGPLPCVKTRATQNTRLHILCSTRIL